MKMLKPGKPKKRLSRKERTKRRLRILYGTIFFMTIAMWYLTRPWMASVNYGICRNFVELQLRFPQTLVVSSLEEWERTQRIYYTYTGSSGEQRASMIECRFTTNPQTGYPWLEGVQVDRVSVDKKKIEAYNRLIPIVMAANPDLTDPGNLDDKDLIDLKTDWQYHDWESSRND
jgi:hypothetical protein